MKEIRKMLERRILSPNNATSELINHLEKHGVKTKLETKSRKVAIIDGKKYSISITGADQDYAECRQHNADGIITFYEKNGKVYLIDNKDLNITSKTREMNNNSYKTCKSKKVMKMQTPSRKIKQLNTDDYKRNYIDVAEYVGKKILGDVFTKLK